MLHQPTLDKLQDLKLTGMLRAYQEQQQMPDSQALSFEERLGLLVDRELTERANRRLATRLRFARLRQEACLGVLRLGQQHGAERLEAACTRALALGAGALNYQSLKSILTHGLEQQPLPAAAASPPPIHHPHIRGAHYYAQEDTTHAASADAG